MDSILKGKTLLRHILAIFLRLYVMNGYDM